MFAAWSADERTAAATLSGALFTKCTLPVLTLTHAAQIHHGGAGGALGGSHSGHRGRVQGASVSVRGEPLPPDVTTSLQDVR